jgi:hypothetical protein
MKTIYFQPKGIKPQYCEIGMILEMDPEYIQYLDEPAKIAISELKSPTTTSYYQTIKTQFETPLCLVLFT